MKQNLIKLLSAAGLISSACTANAQICTNQFWGSNTLYAPQQTVQASGFLYTPAPATYKPIFINYVGRYGASHLAKNVNTTFVYQVLHKADSAHALKVDGRNLYKMLLALQKIEADKLGTLTITGSNEIKGIANRMRSNNANVFAKPGYCIKVSTVKDSRDVGSAHLFLNTLGYDTTRAGCEPINYNDDDCLRYTTACPAYVEFDSKQDWAGDLDNIRDTKKPENFNTRFLTRFFEQAFFDQLDEDVQNKFINALYEATLVQNAIQPEIAQAGYNRTQVDLRQYFTCAELELFNEIQSAKDFLRGGPGIDKQGIQVKAAVPLFVNFINSTDASNISTNVVADLRFTDKEAVGALAVLLNIKEASKECVDILKFSRNWSAEDILPQAANIQMILYRSPDPDFRRVLLVKFLLNEREVAIDGVKAESFPYYKWDDVKDFYLKKLNDDLDIEKLNADMHAYLKNLK